MISPKLTPAQRKLVDEYAELHEKAKAWKPAANPHMARLIELHREISALANREKPEDDVLLVGSRSSVPVTANRIKRTIVNLPGLFKRLGMAWVHKYCIPNLSDVDKALNPEERKAFIEEERCMSRIVGDPVTTESKRKAA